MDLLATTLLQFTSGVIGIWGLAEVIGKYSGWPKDLLALALGPLIGVSMFALGYLPSVTALLAPTPVGWRHYTSAAFAGLIATFGASALNDYLVNPIKARLMRKDG